MGKSVDYECLYDVLYDDAEESFDHEKRKTDKVKRGREGEGEREREKKKRREVEK